MDATAAPDAAEVPDVDAAQPATTLQIRLHDGRRVRAQLNMHHTVRHIQAVIARFVPCVHKMPVTLLIYLKNAICFRLVFFVFFRTIKCRPRCCHTNTMSFASLFCFCQNRRTGRVPYVVEARFGVPCRAIHGARADPLLLLTYMPLIEHVLLAPKSQLRVYFPHVYPEGCRRSPPCSYKDFVIASHCAIIYIMLI